MRVLDLSAGSRAMWADKRDGNVIFIDVRESTSPDIVANSGRLPFADGIFDLVVFDPTHRSLKPNSNLADGSNSGRKWKGYGSFSKEHIRQTLRETAAEAWRVTKPDALMFFKWNDAWISFTAAFGMMYSYWRVMCGSNLTSRAQNETTFCLLFRHHQGVNHDLV